jgi:hypothetical protein
MTPQLSGPAGLQRRQHPRLLRRHRILLPVRSLELPDHIGYFKFLFAGSDRYSILPPRRHDHCG